MIKINLLGDITKIDHSNRFLLFSFLLLSLISSVLCYRIYSQTEIEYKQTSLKLDSLKEQLKRLNEKTQVVRELEAKEKVLREKLLVLARLRKNKLGPVKVLDDLNTAVPKTVWILSLAEQNSSMRILGRALDNQSIALFIKDLQKSDYFESVDLIESKQVYYSRQDKKITAKPVISGGRGVGRQVLVKGKALKKRSGQISENNIRLKDFVLSAKVNYAGELRSKTKKLNIQEDIEFPELKELENL